MSNTDPSVFDAMEEASRHYTALTNARSALASHYERVLSAWLYPGAVISTGRGECPPPRCLVVVRVVSGNARGATTFRIVSAPAVTVSGDGSPDGAVWRVKAAPISSKTGRDMSGATHSRGSGEFVTLGADVYAEGYSDLEGDAYRQHLLDGFMRMAAEAAALLAERTEVGIAA